MHATEKFPARGSWMSRTTWGVVLVGVVVCGAWQINAADEANGSAGLRGILPAAVPVDLTIGVDTLPETWKEWGAGLTADLSKLYEKEGLDAAGQRQAIAALRGRLKTVKASLADPAYRSITSQLVTLNGALKRRVDVAEAALDTLELGPAVKAARIDAAKKQVAQTAQALDAYLKTLRGGEGWVKYLQTGEVQTMSGVQTADKSVTTLADVQTKFKGKEQQADAKVREFLSRPAFVAYEKAVDGYLTAVNNPVTTADSPELRKSLTDLFAAVEEYENTRSAATAGAVRKAFEAARTTSLDGGEKLAQAMRNNYFNYNVRVVASEKFLNNVISQRRQESGPVDDFILGAKVDGSQTTVSDVNLKLRPSNGTAQFDIVVNGTVSSNTAGVTDQATVFTSGTHYYTAEKRVLFNGDRFWTQPARIGVNANNYTYDADTNYSGVPLLGGFARGIAIREAGKKRGESEAIAASRVQDRVLPRFNGEVDKQFGAAGSLNGKLGERMVALQEAKLYPDAKSYSTTDTELRVAARVMAETEMGANEPHPSLVLGRGMTILVHETAMNNAIDRMDFAGQTLTEDELKAAFEANLTKLLGREVKLQQEGEPKPATADDGPKTFVFAKEDPIRFHVADGALSFTLRTGLKQEGKEEIPTQIITIPMTFSVDVKNVVIEPGSVSISPVEKPESAATQIARAGVIKKKVESAFPRREINRVIDTVREGKKIRLAVTRFRALDGWLSITFE